MNAKPPKPLIVLPANTSLETLKEVRSAGYVPILTDSPDKVVVILAGSKVSGDDMLMAALHGVVTAGYTTPMEKFSRELYARMVKNENPPTTPSQRKEG